MNKIMKKSLVLGLILCFILCAAILVACDSKKDTSKDDAKTTYTVTVTSEDSAALTNVKVQLKNLKGETVAEKALEQGKATFELAAADYTVTLTGVPENYSYTDGTLSATQKECTITLSRNKNKYTVTINYPAIKDVYGKTVEAAGPAEGVKVDLYEGQLQNDLPATLEKATLAATKKTDATGRAEFDLDGELYTVVLSGYKHRGSRSVPGLELYFPKGIYVYTLSKTAPTYNARFTDESTFIYGKSASMPIAMNLGVNDLPITEEILESVNELAKIYYSFTPNETGTYTFTTEGNAQILDGDDPKMKTLINGTGSFTLQLEAGKPHTLMCGISAEENMHYTVTVAKDGEERPDPTVSATPFTTFEGAHTVEIKAGTSQDEPLNTGKGKIDPVWYSYTATEGGKYKITDTSENGESVWIYVCKDEANLNGQDVKQMIGDVEEIDIELEAGVTYYFWICTWSETPGTVSFNIEKM